MSYRITDKCVGCGMCRKICPVACIDGQPRKLHVVVSDRCIDCGACGRICPHDAVLDDRGRLCERIRRKALNWEKPLIDYARCMSCAICIEVCPTACLAAIHTEDTRDRKVYPWLAHPAACIGCRFCALECPVDAVVMKAVAEMAEDEKKALDGPFPNRI